MKTRHRCLTLALVSALLIIAGMPVNVLADDLQAKYPLGLVPSQGDFPRFDPARVAALATTLPSSIDLSDALPSVGDQGHQGSCVGWTLGYYYKGYQEGVERGWDLGVAEHQFSAAWIYNQRSTGDCSRDGGMSYYDGFSILKGKGAATLAAVPYDPSDSCTPPSQSATDEAWTYRVVDFSNVFAGRGRANLDTLKKLLAAAEPFAIAAPVYASFYRVTRQNPIVDRHAEGETFYGGHAMLVVGYDDRMEAFRVVNSWGAGWGLDGFCYLSYDFVQHDAWEAWVMEDIVESPAPNTFSGSATVGGAIVPEGTQISAWIGGALVGQTTATTRDGASVYSLIILPDDPGTAEREGGAIGELVEFTIAGLPAAQSANWSTGDDISLDLTATKVAPTIPAPTPTIEPPPSSLFLPLMVR